jgi:hypothetical protein
MNCVFKYPIHPGDVAIEMPIGARVLSVQVQHGEAVIWALVNSLELKELRKFVVVGTGHPCPDVGRFIGTFQLPDLDGSWVFHLFEAA